MWRSEQAYLEDISARREAHWPKEIPREPYYPFGKISLPDYLRHWARESPDKVLYNYYGRLLTYGEIDLLSDRFAALLQSQGIKPGNSVAVFLGTCPQFAIAFLGILKAGAVHVPVNPMFRVHELLYELNDSQATVLVADHALMPLVRKVQDKTALRQIYGTGLAELLPDNHGFHVPESVSKSAPASDAESFLASLKKAGGPTAIDTNLDAVAALNYTGGTTGMPKAVSTPSAT